MGCPSTPGQAQGSSRQEETRPRIWPCKWNDAHPVLAPREESNAQRVLLSLLQLKTSTGRLFSAPHTPCRSRSTRKTEKTVAHRVHRNLGAMNNESLKLKLLLALRRK